MGVRPLHRRVLIRSLRDCAQASTRAHLTSCDASVRSCSL
jgi:hypothetical protein